VIKIRSTCRQKIALFKPKACCREAVIFIQSIGMAVMPYQQN